MKFTLRFLVLLSSLCLAALSCASGPQTTRVSSDTVTDLTGDWNGTDVDIVCKDLINKFLESPRIAQFTAQNKRLPVIRVGTFVNGSNESLDTRIVSKRMQVAILNSGKADFVADSALSEELRAEAAEQQDWASEDTAAALAEETGADFELTGRVDTIRQKSGNQQVREYIVTADATDITTHRIIWSDENSEIKKIIKTPKYKL
jgi:uncharacterized protein (TIGR02722 family)